MTDSGRDKQFNFRAYAWRQFRKNKPAYFSLWALAFLAAVAALAPVIANDEPLYMRYRGEYLFPAFSFAGSYEFRDDETGAVERIQTDIADWKQMDAEVVIWAPIPYSPKKSDHLNADYASPDGEQLFRDGSSDIVDMPGRYRHRLGTNKRGEDVLAGLVHGTRISLTIGILSMGIATLLGIFLGAIAGYFGDHRLTTTRGAFWTMAFGLVLAAFYGFVNRAYVLSDALSGARGNIFLELLISFAIFAAVTLLFRYLGTLAGKLPLLNRRVNIPMDSVISRVIEILISMPRLILILTIAAIAKPSMVNLMIIIGATSWTDIARLTRAEFLKLRSLEYIQAGQALGFTEFRIIFRHALPNGLAPALVAIAFGIASAILIESALSFLGVGVPPDLVTWGSLLYSGREYFAAWWLVVFPGIAIFITVTIYNLLGEGLRDALDPRQKH